MNAPTAITPSIISSLAKALAEIEGVQKNKANPGLKGARYADLSAVIDAIEPIKSHGLWYRQVPKRDSDGALIETFYIHESGDELSAGETFVPASKKDPQGFGSALTYCRRYGLMTAFGLAAEDDDGHAATQIMRNNRPEQEAAPREAKPEPVAKAEMPDTEWAKLVNMMKATDTPPGPMLKHFGVENLRHLNQDQYDKAMERLNSKLAEMAKAETNAAAEISDADIPY